MICTIGAISMYHRNYLYEPLGASVCTIGGICMYHWGHLYVPLGASRCTIEAFSDHNRESPQIEILT
ncbi:MAG: hypothetical protein LKH27_11840 [Prevotella sp.]|nr:hypothetical protein [Prevotella sp.]MCH3991872.1 hypothetical protein [Prevotella sp.]MCH4017561.1 hypothetical protein [Prevotella sp.]MCI1350090.1 hypothetical protein [Prevotella sp.]MCI1450499.1 hypothetical protein [Prevotella sp.]MCI1475080.1 hypothetical protein [Prevotella sp.]